MALLAPAGTRTEDEDGKVRLALLLDKLTGAPPLGAAPLNWTVQVVEPGALIELGLQLKLDNDDATTLLIVPPVALAGREVAVVEAAHGLATPIFVLTTEEATVMLRVATVPLGITVVFIPRRLHVESLGLEMQESDFPAAAAAGEMVAEIAVKLPAG